MKGYDISFSGWTDKNAYYKWVNIFPESKFLGGRVTVEFDFSNDATKAELKNSTGIDTSKFVKEVDLGNLESNVDNLNIDQSKNVPTNLSNLKSKVDKLFVVNLVPVSVDLITLSDVVKNDLYNVKIKNIKDKIPGITNLATNTTFLLK